MFGTRIAGVQYFYRPSAYALVRNSQGDFAVARTPVACFLPGGGIDSGETPEQAIEREAREECGLLLKPLSRIGQAVEICYSIAHAVHYEKDSIFIQADVLGSTTRTEADHQLLWLNQADALEVLSHGSHRWAVQRLMESSIHPTSVETQPALLACVSTTQLKTTAAQSVSVTVMLST